MVRGTFLPTRAWRPAVGIRSARTLYGRNLERRRGHRHAQTRGRPTFDRLDPERVHIALLGDWEADVYILAINDSIRAALLGLFRVRESRRFVFTRTDEG